MQPGEAQKGFSSKSQLFDSLRTYLENKNRLQPIIGLGSIIECVKANADIREAFYMCEVCICRLSRADMRNHIIGSLHRYNYIKTWYPHIVSGWKENFDLSKLAWPLMDIAKILEGREGPGDIQLLEVEDGVYQKIATYSENDAITFVRCLRDGLGRCEPESDEEAAASQSQRIVLLAKNSKTQSEMDDTASHSSPHQTLSEPSGPTGRNSGFFDGYTGSKPLIGLDRVGECKSEDGQTYCFICHCCRTRANKRGITNHITSSSHILNYLMETHPEQVKCLKTADKKNIRFLWSLAEKVEKKEGRGKLKVVNAPEPICVQMKNKSYNWCIKMLFNELPYAISPPRTVAIKGPSGNTAPVQDMPAKLALSPLKWAQATKKNKTKKRKKKKEEEEITNTVFNVSLPLTQGAVLLERTSFSMDSPPSSCEQSSSPEPAVEPLEFQTGDSEWCAVNYSDHNSPRPLQLYDGGAGQHVGSKENFSVSQHQREADYSCVNDPYNYNPSYASKQSYAEQGFNAAPQAGTAADVSNGNRHKEMSSNGNWHHYQQQHPYMAQDHASHTVWPPMPHSVGHPDPSGELVPPFSPARISMPPYSGACYPHSAGPPLEPRTQFHETEQRQLQTYIEVTVGLVQKPPQNYMMHPMAYQAEQEGYGVMSGPNYNIPPGTNGNQHILHPVSGGVNAEAIFQLNAHVLPEPAPCYGTQSNGPYRATGGTAQFIHCNSQISFSL